ncbi:hypothetical protein [Antribacter gilvus]|uniref:hypothetical protein n=1 Tax=Antribacter gilvus TaxID=2304675 RepID=UPI000F7A73B4|nr:hypothetical protein [Antribacter gilvus]
MIRLNVRHHLTGSLHQVAECDVSGCVESMYLPASEQASTLIYLRRLGWGVGDVEPEWRDRPATCPTHSAPQPPQPDTEPKRALWIGRVKDALGRRDIGALVTALADGYAIPDEERSTP